MQLKTIFARIGYPRHTDSVYTHLAGAESAESVSIIARDCSLPRVTVYRCLKVLLADALVEKVVIGKRTFYVAGHPQKLKDHVSIINAEQQSVVAARDTDRSAGVPRNVRFLYGAAGIRAAFDDVIEHTERGDVFYRYTSEKDLATVNRYLARDYRTRRDKKKLERLVISNSPSQQQKRSRLERFIKVIPEGVDQFEHDIIQLMYGKRISIIDIAREEVLIIESERLVEFQKTIFKLLYKRL